MESVINHQLARALMEWQIELGASEAILDHPVDRYALKVENRPQNTPLPNAEPEVSTAPARAETDPVDVARQMARKASTLHALQEAVSAFEHCELKQGARTTVFADGSANAKIMIIGEAPDRDEDRHGRPFVGPAGQLLDRMLAAIGLDRRSEEPDKAVYITNILPWRPPQNRDPQPEEIGMMVPFVSRHVELIDPDVIVLMGNIACQGMLGRRGITRLRGQWHEVSGRPALPMFHPAYLLSHRHVKREAWADLLELRARL